HGDVRRVIPLTAPMATCTHLRSESMFAVHIAGDRYTIVNGATGEKWGIRAQLLRFVGDRLFYVRDRMLFELSRGRARPRWILPPKVLWMSANERGVALSLADGRVAWFDAESALPTWTILPRPAPLLDGDRDSTWIADGGELAMFEAGHARPIAQFDRDIDG